MYERIFLPISLPKMKEVSEILLEKNAVRISLDPPFQWTSGILSPVYCDNRLLTGFPEAREKIVLSFVQKIMSDFPETEIVAGVATGSISWAALVAEKMNLPMIFVRGKAKEHGTKKQVEGYCERGKKVLVIEDLLSTGGSSVDAANALIHEVDAKILGVLAIMSWETPALTETRKKCNFPLVSLTDFSELVPLSAEKGVIPLSAVEEILRFRENPEEWRKSC